VIQHDQMFKLCCRAADEAVGIIRDAIGFDPEKEPYDVERADATMASITYLAAVIIGKLLAHFDESEEAQVCNHIISQAIGLSKVGKHVAAKEEERKNSPIILPGDNDA